MSSPKVGDIWQMGVEGPRYLLLEVLTDASMRQECFYSYCFDNCQYNAIYFSYNLPNTWRRIG